MFRRKLFKRALPVILSVAMIFQSTPATALAAEAVETEASVESVESDSAESVQEQAQQTIEEELLDENGDNSEKASSETMSSEADSKETASSEMDSNETDSSESASSEAASNKTDSGEAGSNEKESNELANQETTMQETNAQETESDEEISETVNQTQPVDVMEGESGEQTPEQNNAVQLVIDYTGIQNAINENSQYNKLSYDAETKTISTIYAKDEKNVFETIYDVIRESYLDVVVDNDKHNELKAHLDVKWQQKDAEGKYINITDGTIPVNAGEYWMLISLPADSAGAWKAAETQAVHFCIEKAEITVDYNESDKAVPGTTVGDAKKQIIETYQLLLNKEQLNKEVYIDGAASVSIWNTDAERTPENALKETDLLLNSGDYIAELTVKLAGDFDKNYKITNTLVNIKMEGAIATVVRAEVKKENTLQISKVYDGKAIDVEKEVDNFLTVVVGEADTEDGSTIAVDEDGKEKLIADAKFTYTWLDANKNEIAASDVVDAGTYAYKISYAGETGRYAAAETEVKVVIETADIAIDPVVDANKKYYAGMTAADILETITEYKVYPITDGTADETKTLSIDEYFWGVAYNQGEKTQSYEPVFVIEEGTIKNGTIKDGTTKDSKTTWKRLSDTDVLEKKENVSYRVIFSGKKRVYDSLTGKIKEADINASQENYRVDLSEKGLNKYAKTIVLEASNEAEIDVSAMLSGEEKAGENFDNAIISTYSGTQLFATRDLYKKAVVKSKSDAKELAKNTNPAITYTWQYREGYQNVYDDDGNLVVDEKGNAVQEPVWEDYGYYGYDPDVENRSTPIDAGDYRIKITYQDSDKAAFAPDAYVYYTIQKKEVKIQLEGTPTAYLGTNVANFISKIAYSYNEDGTRTYVKHSIVGGAVVEKDGKLTFEPDTTEINWSETFDAPNNIRYSLKWYVERLVKEEPEKGSYVRLSDNDKFLEGETYRLAVEFDDYPGSYNNYNNCYELDKHNDFVMDMDNNYKIAYENDSLAIGLEETKGIALDITVDWSKVASKTKVYDGVPLTIDETGIKNAITVTNAKDGSVIKTEDVEIHYSWGWFFNNSSYPWIVQENKAVHAGDYYLQVEVKDNENYVGCIKLFNVGTEGIDYKKFTIVPREITVTPVLNREIKAGTLFSSLPVPDRDDYDEGEEGDKDFENAWTEYINTYSKICLEAPVVKGYIEADAPFFEQMKYYGADEAVKLSAIPLAFKELYPTIYKKGDKAPFNGYFTSDNSYNVTYNGSLYPEFPEGGISLLEGKDYKLTFETIAFMPIRDAATVDSVTVSKADTYGNITRTKLNDDISGDAQKGYTHTITPREGIKYTTKAIYDTVQKKWLSGNYFVIKITAPAEYNAEQSTEYAKNIVYENSIKAAGGILLGTPNYQGRLVQYTVAFDASAKDKKTFEIIWEDGYSESFTVDFANSILMEDLSKAVAPSSLAFNAPVKKMAVGETQQLDLKISKKQMSDIICIMYESSDSAVLNVSETGYVTAVSKGSAVISAYPAYEVEGKKEKIEGAKPATVKITVNDITAVKGIKVEPHDLYAYINYTRPTGGYRREIYVLAGKKTVDNFETEIGNVTNGNYSAFVTEPLFCTSEDGVFSSKGVNYYHKLTNLVPNEEYTVYVRNVSALRTMEDGNKVAVSTAGALKTFKTTKAQEYRLDGYFDETLKSVENNGRWEIAIEQKSTQLLVDGYFREKYSKDYSDEIDYIVRRLPLAKADQTTYVNPKLTYYVTDNFYAGSGSVVVGGYRFAPTSKIAKINNKGKISLKGVGVVDVVVYDAETGSYDVETLHITAKPTAITGKNIKLKVGNTVSLSDYLTYKQKNTKLIGFYDYYVPELSIDVESNEYFEIEPVIYYGLVRDYRITAKMPGGKLVMNVTDSVVEANGGKSAKITLQSAAIDPVKSLKAKDVVDKFGYVTFNYSANNDFKTTVDGSKLAFRIQVQDATGKIIDNRLVNANDNRILKNMGWADAKKTACQYRYQIGDVPYNNIYTGYSLTKLSNYTVTITAVYGDYESKPIKTRLKTTNVPASYYDVTASKSDGGSSVVVGINYNNKDDDDDNAAIRLADYPILKSGNAYTLSLPLSDDLDVYGRYSDEEWNMEDNPYQTINKFVYNNPEAALMKTDALTWKSSNPKAATIKANAGSFTAALKAVKKGSTVITVTSKVTKKVIARWTVTVNAVGEAEGYYGDKVPDDYGFTNAPDDILGVDVLTLSNAITLELGNGESKLVSFTAPAYGRYEIERTDNGTFIVYNKDGDKLKRVQGINRTNVFDREMEKGETYYFLVDNAGIVRPNQKTRITMTASGTEYTIVSLEKGTPVHGGSWITFEAPEDNYYTFTFEKDGVIDESLTKEEPLSKGQWMRPFPISSAASEYIVYVTARKAAPVEKTDTDVPVKISENGEAWYAFTAVESGLYHIYTDKASEAIQAKRYGRIQDSNEKETATPIQVTDDKGNTTTTNNVAFQKALLIEKGQTIYIKLTSEKACTAVLRVDKVKSVKEGGSESVVIANAGGTEYMTFVAPSDGRYRFTSSYTPADDLNVTFNLSYSGSDGNQTGQSIYEIDLTKGTLVTFEISANKAKTAVSVKAEKVNEKKVTTAAPAVVEVASEIRELVTFTAQKEAWYDFSFAIDKLQNATVPTVYVTVINQATGKGVKENTFSINEDYTDSVYMAAGGVITFKLTTNTVKNAKVTVSAAEQTILKLTDTIPALKAGASRRLYWTAPAEGLYRFSTTITEGTDISISYNTKLDETGTGKTDIDLQELTGYMKNGETYYFVIKAKSSNTKDTAFSATVDAMKVEPLTAGQEKAITLKAGEAQWIEFTAKKTARYTYKRVDDAGFAIYQHEGISDEEDQDYGFITDEKYTVGQKRIFKVVNNNAEEKTIKLTVSELTDASVAEVTLQKPGTATVKSGEGTWFKFKADQAARYHFAVKGEKKDATVDAKIMRYTANMLTAPTNNGGYGSNVLDNKVMKAGADIYLYVEAESTGGEAAGAIALTLTATKMSGDPLTIGTAKDVAFAANETKYVAFTADSDEIYTVTVMDGDAYASSSLVSVSWYKNLTTSDDSYGGGSSNFSLNLKKDDKVVIRLTSNTSEAKTLKVKAAKEEAIVLTSEAKSYSMKNGEEKWFKFQSGEQCRYFIEALELGEGLTLSVSSYGTVGNPYSSSSFKIGGFDSDNGYYYSYVGKTGGEVLWKVTASVSGKDEPKSFKIRAGIVSPTPITESKAQDIKVSAIEPYHMVWYSFTPSEAGKYVLKSGGEPTAKVRQFTSKIAATTGSTQSMPCEFDIEMNQIGKERVYAVYYTGSDAKDFAISIQKVTENELTEKTPVSVDITKVEAKEKVWVHFTAPEDGRYTFTNDSSTMLDISCYDPESKNPIGSNIAWGTEKCMEKGDEVLFTASYTTAPQKAFNISVSRPAVDTSLVVSDKAKEVEFKYGTTEDKWLAFKAAATAKYKFEITTTTENTNLDTAIIRYNKINAQNGTSMSTNTTLGMNKDQTIYLRLSVSGTFGEKDSVKIGIKVSTDVEMTALTVSNNTIAEIEAQKEKWAFFTAEEMGFYQFDISGKGTVERYNDVNGSIIYPTYGENGGTFTYGMKAGDSVYFKIKNTAAADTKEKLSESIRITKTSDVKTLVLDAEENVSMTAGAEGSCNYYYYAFEAQQDGRYIISVSDNATIESADNLNDSFSANGSTCIANLGKGDVKYLRIYVRHSADITISCTKAKDTEYINLSGQQSISRILAIGESILVEWTAEEDGYYKFGFEANNQVDYMYSANSDFESADTGSLSDESWSWFGYEGDTRYLLIEAKSDRTRVSISVDKIQERMLNGEDSTQVTLARGEAVIVRWSNDEEAYYRFGFRANSMVEYKYSTEYDFDWYENGNAYNKSWKEPSRGYGGQNIVLVAQTDGTQVTIYADKPEIKPFSGEDTMSISLAKGDFVMVDWTAEQTGYYEFAFQSSQLVDYVYHENKSFNSSTGSRGYNGEWYHNVRSGDGCYLVMEADYDETNVSVSARKVNQSLSIGGSQQIMLDAGESKRVDFSSVNNGKYIFASSRWNPNITAVLYDDNGIKISDTVYSNDEDFRIMTELDADTKCTLELSNMGESAKEFSCGVYQYTMSNQELMDKTHTYPVNVNAGEEVWFAFTAQEAGKYDFGRNNEGIYLELYTADGDELLNRLYGSSSINDRIRMELAVGDKVMLRSYYSGYGDQEHQEGSYEIIAERLDKGEDSWSIPSLGLQGGTSKYLNFYDSQEVMVLCRFSQNGVYSLYTEDNSVTYELYLNDEEVAREQGNIVSVAYNVKEVNSVKIKVKPNDGVTNCDIRVRFEEYFHQEYLLSIDNPITVTVSDGEEAWFVFTVPETGTYKFYSKRVTDWADNYGQLWIDGVLVSEDDDSGEDNQFCIDNQKLTGGQTICLRTYRYNHGDETISYTVHAEKVG